MDSFKYYTSIAHWKRVFHRELGFCLSKIPSKWYPSLLGIDYFIKTGKLLDWNHLTTYSEKMQWAKLYDSTPLKTKLTDKYTVREWVTELIGGDFLIPLLGVWGKFDDIPFDSLPSEFILKTNHGSGYVEIIRDKTKINKKLLKLKFDEWMQVKYAYRNGFEMQYLPIPPKIMAEKLITTDTVDLPDYKFLCFDGKPYYCWVDIDRFSGHKRNVYDMDWNLQSWNHAYYHNSPLKLEKPLNFEEMVRIASILSRGFSHVRVDLYNVQGKIYFGEMTFTNSSGFKVAIPEEYDLELGKLWDLHP